MGRYLLLTLVGGLLLVPGCLKKQDIKVPAPELNRLFGSWKMVQMTMGEAGVTQTPQTLGYNITLEYKTDGTSCRYKNDMTELVDEFSFEYSAQPYAAYGTHYILYSKNSFSNWIHISNDTLYLDGARCNDCGSAIYIRK